MNETVVMGVELATDQIIGTNVLSRKGRRFLRRFQDAFGLGRLSVRLWLLQPRSWRECCFPEKADRLVMMINRKGKYLSWIFLSWLQQGWGCSLQSVSALGAFAGERCNAGRMEYHWLQQDTVKHALGAGEYDL
jgi:hypothetical protein